MELWTRLAEPPGADREMWFRDSDGDVCVTWREGALAARRFAAALRGRGVQPGDRVACILTNSFHVSVAIPGIWFAGATLVSLPTIARGTEPMAYIAQLQRLCQQTGSTMLLIEQLYAQLMPDGTDGQLPIVTYESLSSTQALDPSPLGRDEVALIQYSSGSTSEPKGCELTAGAIERQLEALSEFVEIDGDRDRGAMWLPLSHDMGLFGGLLLAWTTGMAGVMSRPERFLVSPRSWFEEAAAFGATVTMGPSSGLAAASRAVERNPLSGSLRLRTCILGGERIEPSVMRDARAVLGPHGMAPNVLTPAYGMAEATLAVTIVAMDEEPRVLSLDGRALLSGELQPAIDGATAYDVLSCGTPLPDIQVRIDGDGDVGELCVRSPCMAEGYFGDERRTLETFIDGELRTGDWGFLDGGELFVGGRLDDMLVVGGRNVYASAVETAIARETQVRAGNCAIVDVPADGQSSLVLVAEPGRDASIDLRVVARTARQVAAASAGLAITECVFLPHGMFPKTPSGKVQRFRCRELAMGDRVLERIRL